MNKSPLLKKAGTQKLLASLLSILIGLFFGSLLVLIVGLTTSNIGGKGAWDGIRLIFIGLFSKSRDAAGNLVFGINTTNIGNMLFRATPLIMTGLSVAISQKTGLFNIGAPGQYLMGTMVTLMIALSIPSTAVPPFVIWILAFLGGCLAGALWGSIPGMLKAFLNINEVIACIMTNWIAANLVTWLFDIARFSTIKGAFYCQTKWKIADGTFKNLIENTKSGYIYKTTWNNVATPKLGLDKLFPGSQVNAGILVAILIAVAVFIIINKTTFGFQLKACGSNRHAARYAGIKDRANIIYSMAIAGALAAAGASLYYLSGNTEFNWHTDQTLPAIGFNGIPVALLAMNNPVGVIFSGIFMAMLNIIGTQLTKFTAYNEYITDVIIAVIVYLSAFSLALRTLIAGKKKTVVANDANAEKKPAAPPAPKDAKETTPPADAKTEKGGAQA
ncbi:MAG: ABC transporter permease [Oscillospiraceae bacterium]|nr:ABC transporter permease [Oscillospiraceae bacterium]